MRGEISRRAWLLSVVASAGPVSFAWAQSPGFPSHRGASAQLPVSASLPTVKSVSTMTVRSIGIRGGDDAESRVVVSAMATDPSGELLAVAGDDDLIRILNASTLTIVHTLVGHRDIIRALAFDPATGNLSSAGNDGQLITWDAGNDYRLLHRLTGTPALHGLSYCSDGSLLAAVGFDQRVYLIGNDKRDPLRCEGGDLRAVAFRDDDRLLAVGGRSGKLHLFDTLDRDAPQVHPIHSGRIRGIAFHGDANLVVTVGEDGWVCVLDTEQGQLRNRTRVTTGKLFALAIIDSQRAAVAGSDNRIQIVNTDVGKVETRLDEHQGSIASLAAGGGMLFSGGYDATLKRWPISDLSRWQQRIAEANPDVDRE